MRTRTAARLSVLVTAIGVPFVLGAAPALAGYHPDDGEVPGAPLGTGLTILIFLVIPVGAFLVIGGLSLLPSALRKPRYRPGRPWNHDPLWFRGPEDPETALRDARPGATARGGASADY